MQLLSNLNALLVTNPTNIRYLTGFVGAAPGEREAYVLVTKSQGYLFTNALYRQEAIKLTQNRVSFKRLNLLGTKGLTFIEISREEPFEKKLKEILTGSRPVIRLGFEENDLTVVEYEKLKKELKDISLVATKGRVEELRMIKRKDEIENIRAAAGLADQCFDFIIGKLKPSVTEGEIAWEIESFIRNRGAQLAFSPIVAFGANTSQPHYQTSEVRLMTSDIILLDFGARVNGYCSDMTRVVFTGKPKDEWIKVYDTVLQAQSAALEYLASLASRPGLEATSGDADRLAREVIEKAGFPAYPHSLGHGVGLDIHEAPRLTIKKYTVLKPGMVLTVEPAIYKEASYGIRLEDLVVLKEDGVKILSQSPKTLTII